MACDDVALVWFLPNAHYGESVSLFNLCARVQLTLYQHHMHTIMGKA